MHGNEYTHVINECTTSLESSFFASILYGLPTESTTDEEHAVKGSFVCHKLVRPSDLDQWVECCGKQLEDHHDVPPFGDPVLRHSIKPLNILCIHWNNVVKLSGVYKCRHCMDTSRRVRRGCDCSCRCDRALGNHSRDYSPLCVLPCALPSPVVNCSRSLEFEMVSNIEFGEGVVTIKIVSLVCESRVRKLSSAGASREKQGNRGGNLLSTVEVLST